MRAHGQQASTKGLGVRDHACWAFEDEEEFRAAAIQYLNEGRRLGQRLFYVGRHSTERLREEISDLEEVDRLIDEGALQVLSLPAIHKLGEPLDPEAQLEVYAAHTEQALADGFTGLRVAAEATALVEDPATWEAHIRWEALADSYMAINPLSALCAYDRSRLPEALVTDLARVHPVDNCPAELTPFRVYSKPGGVAIDGNVDQFCAEGLSRILGLLPGDDGGSIIDLAGLEFIDPNGLFALTRHLELHRQNNRPIEVWGAPYAARRLAEMLGIEIEMN